MNEEQDGLSDADLWEALVKQGKSPAMATALVHQRRQQASRAAGPGVGAKIMGSIASLGRDIPGVEALQSAARSGTSGPFRGGAMGVVDVIGNAIGNGREGYTAARNEIREAEDAAPMPATLPARLVGGGLATAMLPGGAAMKGAQYGALSGALSSDPNSGMTSRAIGAGVGAGTGALVGRYAGKVGGAIAKPFSRFKPAVALQPFPKTDAGISKADGLLQTAYDHLGEIPRGTQLPARAPAPRIPIRPPVGAAVTEEAAPRAEGLLSSKWDEVVEALNARKAAGAEPPMTPRAPAPPIAEPVPTASAATGWKPRGAAKSRFEWFAQRMAQKAEPEIVGSIDDIPPEELMRLTLEHIKKGGSLKSASDALKIVRKP